MQSCVCKLTPKRQGGCVSNPFRSCVLLSTLQYASGFERRTARVILRAASADRVPAPCHHRIPPTCNTTHAEFDLRCERHVNASSSCGRSCQIEFHAPSKEGAAALLKAVAEPMMRAQQWLRLNNGLNHLLLYELLKVFSVLAGEREVVLASSQELDDEETPYLQGADYTRTPGIIFGTSSSSSNNHSCCSFSETDLGSHGGGLGSRAKGASNGHAQVGQDCCTETTGNNRTANSPIPQRLSSTSILPPSHHAQQSQPPSQPPPTQQQLLLQPQPQTQQQRHPGLHAQPRPAAPPGFLLLRATRPQEQAATLGAPSALHAIAYGTCRPLLVVEVYDSNNSGGGISSGGEGGGGTMGTCGIDAEHRLWARMMQAAKHVADATARSSLAAAADCLCASSAYSGGTKRMAHSSTHAGAYGSDGNSEDSSSGGHRAGHIAVKPSIHPPQPVVVWGLLAGPSTWSFYSVRQAVGLQPQTRAFMCGVSSAAATVAGSGAGSLASCHMRAATEGSAVSKAAAATMVGDNLGAVGCNGEMKLELACSQPLCVTDKATGEWPGLVPALAALYGIMCTAEGLIVRQHDNAMGPMGTLYEMPYDATRDSLMRLHLNMAAVQKGPQYGAVSQWVRQRLDEYVRMRQEQRRVARDAELQKPTATTSASAASATADVVAAAAAANVVTAAAAADGVVDTATGPSLTTAGPRGGQDVAAADEGTAAAFIACLPAEDEGGKAAAAEAPPHANEASPATAPNGEPYLAPTPAPTPTSTLTTSGGVSLTPSAIQGGTSPGRDGGPLAPSSTQEGTSPGQDGGSLEDRLAAVRQQLAQARERATRLRSRALGTLGPGSSGSSSSGGASGGGTGGSSGEGGGSSSNGMGAAGVGATGDDASGGGCSSGG